VPKSFLYEKETWTTLHFDGVEKKRVATLREARPGIVSKRGGEKGLKALLGIVGRRGTWKRTTFRNVFIGLCEGKEKREGQLSGKVLFSKEKKRKRRS